MAKTTAPPLRTQSEGVQEFQTILVVDDDKAIRKLCTAVLKGAGYNVFSAEDGLKAIEICLAGRSRVDLALLDIKMPKMSGLRLLDCLASSRTADRFILMSGYICSNDDAFANAASNRSYSFLLKPFTPPFLVETVRREFSISAPQRTRHTEKPETTLSVA
jgi:DNA-binding NtrC family response regulator